MILLHTPELDPNVSLIPDFSDQNMVTLNNVICNIETTLTRIAIHQYYRRKTKKIGLIVMKSCEKVVKFVAVIWVCLEQLPVGDS